MVRRTDGGCAGACWGAGDVAGVSLMKGLSEKVSDEALDPLEDDGNASRVPSREPSGVRRMGCGAATGARVNRPNELRTLGAAR